jgi:hypothetical protein
MQPIGELLMFAPFCYRHGSRVLLSTTAITALIPTDCGLVAHFTCTCGETGIWQAAEQRAVGSA